MELLADETVDAAWILAVRDDGHEVLRVGAVDEPPPSAIDPAVVAVAARLDRVLPTAESSDFTDPPIDDHAGVLIVVDGTRTGGGLRCARRPIEEAVRDRSPRIAS
jgi:hypothetical protein